MLGLAIKADFAIVDSVFPQKVPLAFRNSEINEYFKKIKNCKSFTMFPMSPDKDAWFTHGYGVDRKTYLENKDGYLAAYPSNRKFLNYLKPNTKYNFKLAYSFFLAETYVLLPFYEYNNIPFVFVLYPGGSFGLGNTGSDNMLRKIFASKFFRGVIVTQNITKNYLIENKLCDQSKIEYIYGGFVQFKSSDILQRRYYGKEKSTLDVCFVAAKYSKKGLDKGYDIFIEVAKDLIKKYNNIRFHVVGGMTEQDIDISLIKDRVRFYGFMNPSELAIFYRDMDIFLAPNRPFKLYEGNFDGFPLGIDAGYCGVAIFVSDILKMNDQYSHDELEIIEVNTKHISKKIAYYYERPDLLKELANRGQKKTQKLFDIDLQIEKRINWFNKFVDLSKIK